MLLPSRYLPQSRSVSPCMPATLRHLKSRSSRSRWTKSIVGGLSIALRCHSTPLPIDSRVHLHLSVLRLQRHRKSAIPHGSTSDHQDSRATRVDRSRLVWWHTALATPLISALSSVRAHRKQLSSANRFPELHRSAVLRCASPMERRNSASGGVGRDSARSRISVHAHASFFVPRRLTNVAADKHFWIARYARIVRCACS